MSKIEVCKVFTPKIKDFFEKMASTLVQKYDNSDFLSYIRQPNDIKPNY